MGSLEPSLFGSFTVNNISITKYVLLIISSYCVGTRRRSMVRNPKAYAKALRLCHLVSKDGVSLIWPFDSEAYIVVWESNFSLSRKLSLTF